LSRSAYYRHKRVLEEKIKKIKLFWKKCIDTFFKPCYIINIGRKKSPKENQITKTPRKDWEGGNYDLLY
jgi:hypothetical protein